MISLITKTEKEEIEKETISNMDEYDKTVPISGGFTRYELQEAFNLVVNKTNWKNPTCTKISKRNLSKYRRVIEQAVPFFTGSCAEFTYSTDSLGRITHWCEFDGYYMCIGS